MIFIKLKRLHDGATMRFNVKHIVQYYEETADKTAVYTILDGGTHPRYVRETPERIDLLICQAISEFNLDFPAHVLVDGGQLVTRRDG